MKGLKHLRLRGGRRRCHSRGIVALEQLVGSAARKVALDDVDVIAWKASRDKNHKDVPTFLGELCEVNAEVRVGDHFRSGLDGVEDDPLLAELAHREPVLVQVEDVRTGKP